MSGETPATNVVHLHGNPATYKPRRHSDFVSWYNSGFRELVPVAPPMARIAEGSKLLPTSLGKVPALRTDGGTWTGFPHWQLHRASRDDVERWRSWNCNAGMSCYSFAGLDIDVRSVAAQDAIDAARGIALQLLGDAPCRTGQAPKQLLLFRTAQPMPKRQLRFYHADQPGTLEKPYVIEMLGAGQQFVLEGTHPSGSLYTWDRDPRPGGPEGLVEVDAAQVDLYLRAVSQRLVALGYVIAIGGTSHADRDGVDQDSLIHPDLDAIERAVAAIPNDNQHFPDRAGYVRVGVAIKAAFRDEPERGLAAYQEWASRWPGNGTSRNDDATVEKDWAGFKPPFGIGADYLLELAFRHGHVAQGGEFSVHSLFDDLTPRYQEAALAEALDWTRADLPRLAPRLERMRATWPGFLDRIAEVQALSFGITKADLEEAIQAGTELSRLGTWSADSVRAKAGKLVKHQDNGELDLPLGAYFDEWHRRGTLTARDAFSLFGRKVVEVRGQPFNANHVVLFAEAAMAIYGRAMPLVDHPACAHVLRSLLAHSPPSYGTIAYQLAQMPDWPSRSVKLITQTVTARADEFRRALAVQPLQERYAGFDDQRPNFRYVAADKELHASELCELLEDSGTTLPHEPVFRYGRQMVTVRASEPIGASEVQAEAAGEGHVALDIVPYDVEAVTLKLMETVRFQTYSVKGAKWTDGPPPEDLVRLVLSRGASRGRLLTGTVTNPVVGPGGRIVDRPGYDEATKLFVHFGGTDFHVAGIERSREAALRAYGWFVKVLFDGFEFASPRDETVAVSALLTLVVRRLIDQAPAYAVTAPIQASGKTTLVQVICRAILGRTAAASGWPKVAEEFEKRIVGWLSQGMPAVLFDNLDDGSMVYSSELARALTSETYNGRLLGKNVELNLPTNVTWFLTGNGLTISRDLATRVLTCTLEPKAENPESRSFTRVDPGRWAAGNRVAAVHHALAIILAYVEAQRHGGSVLRGTRFEQWDALVRQPLAWMFDEDPARDIGKQFDMAVSADRMMNPRDLVLKALRAGFKTGVAFSLGAVRDLMDGVVEAGAPADNFKDEPESPGAALRSAVEDYLGDRKPTRHNLAKLLRQLAGRVIDGARLVQVPNGEELVFKFAEV